MKNKTLLDWVILVGVILMIFCTLWVVLTREPLPLGSVSHSDEYISTTTRNSVTGVALATGQILALGQGTLGSVVITGAGAGTINLYDATSTITNSQYGTTTLVTIPASAAAGTYTFDIQFKRGLVYEFIGTAPTTTITFRK